MEFELKIDAKGLQGNLDEIGADFRAALRTSANMIASMMKSAVEQDIRSAGKFGDRFLSGLSVTSDGTTITTKLEGPGADLFAHGGTITGKPLLWIPISGTDAEGIEAGNYGDKLFSVNRAAGGVPLLFSVADKAPKYFGVPSVTIPQKFNIEETEKKVMAEFPAVFSDALKG